MVNYGNDGRITVGSGKICMKLWTVPMRYAWHYNTFNVGHHILPRLWFNWSRIWYERCKVTRLYIWQNTSKTIQNKMNNGKNIVALEWILFNMMNEIEIFLGQVQNTWANDFDNF